MLNVPEKAAIYKTQVLNVTFFTNFNNDDSFIYEDYC